MSARPLTGRPNFNVNNVRAGNKELGLWLALNSVCRRLLSQRHVLATRYHEALALESELLYATKTIRRLESVKTRNIRSLRGRSVDALSEPLEDVAEYAWSIASTQSAAAESFIYMIDHLIKFAGKRSKITKDNHLLGGKYIKESCTLFEGFRVMANWQRHHLEWNFPKSYNDQNFNHLKLKELGLLQDQSANMAFLRMLKRKSYLQLEQDIVAGLEYLVCEIGMKHGENT